MSTYASEVARQTLTLAQVIDANLVELERARGLIAGAGRVRLAALGSSRHAAGYGAAVLDLVAGVAAHVLDAPGVAVPRSPGRPGDLLIVVTQSGLTPALVELAAQVRDTGASIIAVVNAEGGVLTATADVVLRCGVGIEGVVAATGSVTAQMLLLRALAGDVTRGVLDELVAAVQETVAASPTLEVVPRRVVAAGVAGEWVAEEVCLKLAEVAGVLASAESLVDFLHGAVAVDAPTLALLDPRDPNAEVVAASGHTVSAGPSPSYSFPLPAVSDPTTAPIARVVAGQVIALAVAELLGTDPDDSRGLHKVTMTA